jgi:hypothetical protein
MKLVIVADIHGNHDALRALPEDYDELWVLGDLDVPTGDIDHGWRLRQRGS